ncbi:eukaryotic translation initiation factor 3 subunit G-like [Watersipora subatra]|uniref:eukaryotic translation initiation factor 3 subunit G-like n=1 Tax=Watersipora subatra TaxID=2589382 RepID=UPI00355BF895
MPSLELESEAKPSWADQVEEGDHLDLPPRCETFDKNTGTRVVTEYKIDDDGKKVKVVKTYKVETRKVSKSIAKRKAWKKFGEASSDPPGPNPSNTICSVEEIYMQFVHTKEAAQEAESETDPLAALKGQQKMVQCRICKGEHWTTKCPYKDTLVPLQESLNQGTEATPQNESSGAAGRTGGSDKYVPPSLRAGAGQRKDGETMSRRDDLATIRVTNLSEDTREDDLQELFRPFGNISRIYLAKDKNTGASKGFAFINFHRKEDAARAIKGVSGFGYDHLILKVEWAKPSGDSNK